MNFEQVIPFDTTKGGTTPNLCLDNVCKGYGIPDKYGSAWEAWEHTQQHADRNVPLGLAVPIYYSYTATIDGETKNYGHINVQLPNGTVWSDGNVYVSIDDYTAKKAPRFVGWGESVNDFKIIGGDMATIVDQNILSLLTSAICNSQPIDTDKSLLGMDMVQATTILYNDIRHKNLVAQADKAGELQQELDAIGNPIQLEEGKIYKA